MKAGIWIDQRKAVIIMFNGEDEDVIEVTSDIEEFHAKGGFGGARKDMPQDAQSDKKFQARKQKQIKQFFAEVLKKLPKLERLLVFGPGETKKFFVAALRSRAKFADTRVKQDNAEQMTLNQMHARIQEHFKLKNTRPQKQSINNIPLVNIEVEHEFVKMRVSDAMEIMVNEKLAALKKRYDRIIRAKVFYKKDKDPNAKNFICEMELSFPGENLFAVSRATDLALAITETIKDLERQLRKWKSKKIRR
jgi:putative sigma-54 modulation protein